MADSDEENEKGKSRDKFRRERSDYGEKSRSRSDHRERRSSYRDEHDSGRRRGRDDMEDDRERRGYRWGSPPPSKRMRRDGW